jgi:hypothetical protein
VHHALVCGALSAAPLCRVFGQELSPLLGSEALEAQCMRKSVTPAADMAHALAALLFCVAVLTDGWASPVRLLLEGVTCNGKLMLLASRCSAAGG